MSYKLSIQSADGKEFYTKNFQWSHDVHTFLLLKGFKPIDNVYSNPLTAQTAIISKVQE